MKVTFRPWIVRIAAAVVAGAPLITFIAESRAADLDPPPASAATTTTTTMPAATAATQPDRMSSSIALIRRADNPSAAVDAYARAAAAEGGTAGVPAQAAYVRKMVDLNMPELAEAQAQELIRRDPADGVAWAVVAYMAAAHGDSGLAARDLVVAMRHLPDDSFVLRTAAQVVAWYDTQPDHSRINDTDRGAIEELRAAGADRPVFADAYRASAEMQRDARVNAANAPGGPTTAAPATAPTTAPSPQPAVAYSPPQDLSDYTLPPVSYPYGYYASPYAYGGGGWPGCWGWGSGWCSFPGAIIVSDFAFVHGFHHHGFFVDHNHFDHNHFANHFHGDGGARFFDARSSRPVSGGMVSPFAFGGINRMGPSSSFRGPMRAPISSPTMRGMMSMPRPSMMRSPGAFGGPGPGGSRGFAAPAGGGGRMR